MSKFSHLDSDLNPAMVNVGDKQATKRKAIARSIIEFDAIVKEAFLDDDIQSPKGPVFNTANIAGIMAAKKTSELIPLCHPLSITHVLIDLKFNEHQQLQIDCTVELKGKTGVEMEALMGASVAALTVYDMCKAMSHNIVIKETRLIHKSGGKSDYESS